MGGGGTNLQVLIGNLLLQNPTVSGAGIPRIEISVPANPAGRADGGTATITITGLPSTAGVQATLQDLRRLVPELSSVRIVLPSVLGNPSTISLKGVSVADLQSWITALQDHASPDVLMGGMQNEAQAGVLSMGSQTVFSQLLASPGASAFGQAPAASRADGQMPATALLSAGEIVFGVPKENHGPAQPGLSSSPAAAESGLVRVPLSDSVRLPEVAREILTSLGLLPPGVGSEEALPRLQEVLRLWTSGASQGGELPAHIAQIVDNVLKSAVLATALSNGIQAAQSTRDGQAAETSRGVPGTLANALFSPESRAPQSSGPLTRAQIANAVMSALAGTATALPNLPAGARPSGAPGDTIPAPASQTANLGTASADKQTLQTRTDALRGDVPAARAAQADQSSRDAKQVRLTGDEHHERAEVREQDLETQRAPHEQDSQGHAEDTDTHAAEALWGRLSEALQRGGFVAANGALRSLEFSEDGRAVLNLIAPLVPEGWDLIDALALVDARMGLSPEAGAVNGALHRLAAYRRTWKNDKVRALLEPLHDAFVSLGLVSEDIIQGGEADISIEDLKGFQTHLAAVQMILDRPRWINRIGDEEDRVEIARVLPDVEELLESIADKLPASARPEYFDASVDPAAVRH